MYTVYDIPRRHNNPRYLDEPQYADSITRTAKLYIPGEGRAFGVCLLVATIVIMCGLALGLALGLVYGIGGNQLHVTTELEVTVSSTVATTNSELPTTSTTTTTTTRPTTTTASTTTRPTTTTASTTTTPTITTATTTTRPTTTTASTTTRPTITTATTTTRPTTTTTTTTTTQRTPAPISTTTTTTTQVPISTTTTSTTTATTQRSLGIRYELKTTPETWEDASTVCANTSGGQLAEIRTLEQFDAVNALITTRDIPYWIDVKVLGGVFTWVQANVAVNCSSFPGVKCLPVDLNIVNGCVTWTGDIGEHLWDDVDCAEKHEFVCQYI